MFFLCWAHKPCLPIKNFIPFCLYHLCASNASNNISKCAELTDIYLIYYASKASVSAIKTIWIWKSRLHFRMLLQIYFFLKSTIYSILNFNLAQIRQKIYTEFSFLAPYRNSACHASGIWHAGSPNFNMPCFRHNFFLLFHIWHAHIRHIKCVIFICGMLISIQHALFRA